MSPIRRITFDKYGHPRWVRLRMFPFETAIAVLVMVQGILNLTGLGPSMDIVPPWAGVVILAAYTTAGAATLLGLALARGDIEAFGLTVLGTTIIARSLLLMAEVGWDTGVAWISFTFALVFAWACFVRVRTLMPGGAERMLGQRNEEA